MKYLTFVLFVLIGGVWSESGDEMNVNSVEFDGDSVEERQLRAGNYRPVNVFDPNLVSAAMVRYYN
jgi:hypothetical protein